MKEALLKLVELQKADHQAADAERRRVEFDKAMEGVDKLLAESKAGVEAAHKALQDAQSSLKLREVEVKGKEQRISDLTGKLGGASSNKEYQGLLVEIGALKAEIGRIEETMLVSMEEIEVKDKLHEAAKAKLRETEAIHRAARAEVDQRRKSFEDELAAARAARDAIAVTIPPETLKVYDRIRAGNKRTGTAVCVVHGEYCQGCQMSISAQEYSDLIAGKALVLCRSCHRILVLDA